MAASANAAWHYRSVDDAFDGDKQIAMSIDGSGYAVGLRCTSPADLTLLFMTPEKTYEDGIKSINAQSDLRLLVIIDDEPKVELIATTELTADNTLSFYTDDEEVTAIARAAAQAKTRFAIAVQAADKRFHSKSFDVRGSRKVVKRLIETCKLDKPA